jgi:hypothetical protein
MGARLATACVSSRGLVIKWLAGFDIARDDRPAVAL